MPVGKYYGGRGEKVKAEMRKRYGTKKGDEVFYATANKQKKRKPAHPKDRAERRSLARRFGI
jgi:hypothetical protein